MRKSPRFATRGLRLAFGFFMLVRSGQERNASRFKLVALTCVVSMLFALPARALELVNPGFDTDDASGGDVFGATG